MDDETSIAHSFAWLFDFYFVESIELNESFEKTIDSKGDDETLPLLYFTVINCLSSPKGIDRLIHNAPDLLLSISTFKFPSPF